MKIRKCKQHGDVLSFGISVPYHESIRFLNLQLTKHVFKVYVSQDAPPIAAVTHSQVASVIRKQIASLHLAHIVWNDQNLQAIFLSRERMIHFLIAFESGFPTLSVVTESGMNLIRYSAKGTFTKRKQQSPPPTPSAFENLVFKLIQETTRIDGPVKQALLQGYSDRQRFIRDRLARRLKVLKKSFSKLMASSRSENELNAMERDAAYLQQHLFQPTDTASDIVFQNTTVKAEPYASPGSVLNKLHTAIKKTRKSLHHSNIRLREIKSQISDVSESLSELRQSPLTEMRLDELENKYRILMNMKTKRIESDKQDHDGFRVFFASDGSRIHLGRNAVENDALTKRARSNDYWFHAVNASGSHVIVPSRFRAKGLSLSEKTIREACILALHFSKMSRSRGGEVYVATRAHLRKSKGMPPGQWNVLKSKTLTVRYSQEEVDALFQRTSGQ